MLFREPVGVWPRDGASCLFLLLGFACRRRVHSLRKLPPRNALASWLSVHIVDGLPVKSLLLVLWLSLSNQSFRERILVYVVLVVQLWHREAADSLRPILANMAVVCIGC